MSIDINTAARRVRAAFKKLGYDPKGRVSVKNSCCGSVIDVDLPRNEQDEEAIQDAMGKIDSENYGEQTFDWWC